MSDLLGGILAAVGGGIEGGFRGYSYEKELGLKERGLDQKEEIARLREEVRLMLEQVKEEGRNRRHDDPSGNTVLTEGGRMDRWQTPSANATLAEEGRMSRWNTPSANVREQISAAWDRHTTPSANAELAEEGRMDRWVTPSGNTRLLEQGRDARYDRPSANAQLGAQTTQRGQDISSETSRFVAGEATKRASMRRDPLEGLFTAPGTTPVTPTAPAPPAAAPSAPAGTVPRGATEPIFTWPDGTKRAYPPDGAAPAPAARPGRTPVTTKPPVTPPATEQPVQPKAADATADREVKRRQRFEQIKAQIADRQKRGLAIDDLLKELQKLRAQGVR